MMAIFSNFKGRTICFESYHQKITSNLCNYPTLGKIAQTSTIATTTSDCFFFIRLIQSAVARKCPIETLTVSSPIRHDHARQPILIPTDRPESGACLGPHQTDTVAQGESGRRNALRNFHPHPLLLAHRAIRTKTHQQLHL